MRYVGKQSIFDDLMIGGVLFTPPDPATYSYELTLPDDDGTPGQFLTTDGSGVLTWTTAAGSGVTMTNGVDNRVMTATGATSITGEADLTYDDSTEILTVGAIQMRGPGGGAAFSYNGSTYASYLEMPSSEGLSDSCSGAIIKVADGSGSVEAADLLIEGGNAAGTNMRGGIMRFNLGTHTGTGTPGSFLFKGSSATEIARIGDIGLRLPIADQGLIFEGGSYDTTLKAQTSVGAARTITLPDATGTVALTSDIPALSVPVTVPQGGTGLTTVGANELVTGNGTGALTSQSTLTYSAHILNIGDDGSTGNTILSPNKASGQAGTAFNLRNGDTSGTDIVGGYMTFSSGLATGNKTSGAYIFKGGPMGDPTGGTTPSPVRDMFTISSKAGAANSSFYKLHDLNSTRDFFQTTITTAAAVSMQNIHGSGVGTPSITIDSTGDLNLTSTTNIEINADGGDIDFKDSTAQLAKISTEGISFQDNTGAGVIFEGATDNAYQTTLRATDPTGTRAINLPDDSGTVALQEKSIIVKNMGFYNTSTSAFYLPMLEYIAESTYVTSYVSSFVAPYDGKVIKVGPGWSNSGSSKTSTYKFFKNKQSSTQTGTTATTASFTTTIPEVTPTDWTFSKGEPIHIQVTNSVSIQSVSMTVTIELDLTT